MPNTTPCTSAAIKSDDLLANKVLELSRTCIVSTKPYVSVDCSRRLLSTASLIITFSTTVFVIFATTRRNANAFSAEKVTLDAPRSVAVKVMTVFPGKNDGCGVGAGVGGTGVGGTGVGNRVGANVGLRVGLTVGAAVGAGVIREHLW